MQEPLLARLLPLVCTEGFAAAFFLLYLLLPVILLRNKFLISMHRKCRGSILLPSVVFDVLGTSKWSWK